MTCLRHSLLQFEITATIQCVQPEVQFFRQTVLVPFGPHKLLKSILFKEKSTNYIKYLKIILFHEKNRTTERTVKKGTGFKILYGFYPASV